ncbi:hypothetical protein E1287_30795 [Actinomadura sp. KC06]|uniref:hypothetical protein n=1 Tax=Actinomadura sp. KC06 TaxID=2530369 RepID=UPI0010482CF3|nr:hypothetical protein [Actinomadura sp. KC06]TDD29509.1 hypothetical protein E1287_30795 [Actinomadura sp. KC06]
MYRLIDLTRAHAGTEGAILEAFNAAHDGPPPTAVEYIAVPGQARPDGTDGHIWTELPGTVDDAAVTAAVHERVGKAHESGVEISVASFRGSVKSVVEMLDTIHGGVEFIHLGTFAPPTTGGERLDWDDAWMKREDAVNTLVHAIGASSGQSRMTDLRKHLSARDPRFRKQAGTFTARPKFMSTLVSLAEERGLVAVVPTGTGDNNPQIALTAAGYSRLAPASPVSPSDASASSAPLAPVPAAGHEPRSLSHLCVDVLRQNNMGPFQELRQDIYRELERLVEEKSRTADQLIRDAVHAVRDKSQDAPSKSGKKFPWSRIRAFLTRLTRQLPVFLSGGTPVAVSLGNNGTVVDGLADDWWQMLDGELICFVLGKGVAITQYDYEELAGALYNSRSTASYDKVQEVVDHLARVGRITEAPDDVMRIVLVAPPMTHDGSPPPGG